jgi:Lon protease-like protein
MTTSYDLAMFPLESPIVPGQLIPLHLFEPRYRLLARDLAQLGEPEFGIVGIARGREVGGEDVRTDVGVVARVVQSEEQPDGRWAILATGTRRIRVERWLEDDPYPRALVSDWPDPLDPNLDEPLAALRVAIDALVAMVAGYRPDLELAIPELSDDPGQAIWQLIGFAGLGPLDLLRLLATPDAAERAVRAAELIDERRQTLDALGLD